MYVKILIFKLRNSRLYSLFRFRSGTLAFKVYRIQLFTCTIAGRIDCHRYRNFVFKVLYVGGTLDRRAGDNITCSDVNLRLRKCSGTSCVETGLQQQQVSRADLNSPTAVNN